MKKELYTEKGGISMTSAQYLSNLGQEKAKEYKEKLSSPQFYDIGIKLVGDTGYTPMSTGMTKADLEQIPELLDFIARMDAFTAYVREAMKDKDATLQNIRRMRIEDWIRCTGHDPYPEVLDQDDYYESKGLKPMETLGSSDRPVAPAPECLELDELVKKLPLEQYQEYLELDAKAAVLGKFSHSDKAPIVVARRDYIIKNSKPLEKEGTGRDTCIYQYTPSVPATNLEDTFEGLQKAYREAEKKLNKVRFDLREAESTRFATENAKYQKELSEFHQKEKEIDDYNSKLLQGYLDYKKEVYRQRAVVDAEFEDWRTAERSRVSKLKIIIPSGLQSTYEYLESLGEKKESEAQ